ncbi:hypothetical protein DL770_002742 [Monosporascus sp. CRB-9-2]|nr:hypothetical protein DL770_002742 [Monosporascus sp. CRB-9-2]
MARPRVVQPLLLISAAIMAVSGTGGSLARFAYIRQEPEWPPEIAGSVHDASWPDFLEFMTRNNITWLARSGGHGYSPTLRTIQNAVMVNMENFRYASINSDLSVSIGSGATFQDMIDAVGGAGRELRATGASLGGGVGRLQGKYGITSDSIRRVRMALWNGTIVEASDDINQDLFWGVRGAGQNFGIVIETTFETYPASDGGMHYNVDMTFSGESLETVIDTINSLIPDMDPALAIITLFTIDADSLEAIVALGLVYAGSEVGGRRYAQLFAPFSRTFNESLIPWVDLPSQSAGGGVAANCQTGLRHNMYSLASRDLPTSTYREIYDSFSELIVAYPGLNRSIVLIETFGQEGVSALPNDYSAFPHRGEIHNLVVLEMVYTDDTVADVADDFAHGWRDVLAQPENSGYDRLVVYQNYGHDDEPLSALYGYDEWRHERLSSLKRSYDPKGHFNGYHAIPIDSADWS